MKKNNFIFILIGFAKKPLSTLSHIPLLLSNGPHFNASLLIIHILIQDVELAEFKEQSLIMKIIILEVNLCFIKGIEEDFPTFF